MKGLTYALVICCITALAGCASMLGPSTDDPAVKLKWAAEHFSSKDDPAAAEKLIREAIAVKEDVRLARYNLALLAEGRGDLLNAEREYLQELKLHPDSYKAAFNLSLLYERTGQRDLRIDALKMAIDGNAAFAEGHIFLAKAYLERGSNLGEAAALARTGLGLSPSPEVAPLGHYVLADIYNRQGRPAEASREVALGRALEARLRRGSR